MAIHDRTFEEILKKTALPQEEGAEAPEADLLAAAEAEVDTGPATGPATGPETLSDTLPAEAAARAAWSETQGNTSLAAFLAGLAVPSVSGAASGTAQVGPDAGRGLTDLTSLAGLLTPVPAAAMATDMATGMMAGMMAGGASQAARPGAGGDPFAFATAYLPGDTLFPNQWHLNNTGQSGGLAGIDLDILNIWDEFSGAGVTVGIWDDGVQYDHPDLNDNYDASLHITLGGTVHDPYPESTSSRHGTAVAGIIAAENDGTGTVGVAFGASIAGVDKFFDGVHDPIVWSNMTVGLQEFDVTNHSWSYTSPFAANILDASSFWQTFFEGLVDSTEFGRGGLGTVNVKSAGNSRLDGRDANDSGFNNMPQTIAVAAVGHDGLVSFYSTPGAAVLVSAPSNGPTGSGIWTTDITGALGYSDGTNQPGNTSADHTSSFGGTSSSAPMVAGVVALMLEANPLLGWRDVQDILALSARHVGSDFGTGPTGTELYTWSFNGATTWNAGGLHFSNDYGFGLLSAHYAVRLAETWDEQDTNANWVEDVVGTWTGSQLLPDDGTTVTSITFTVTGGIDIEHVGLQLNWNSTAYTGDYRITLISPDGTVSELSKPFNNGDSFTDSWIFTSNAFRGENGVGDWTLQIRDEWADFEGTLTGAALGFLGNATRTDQTYVFTDEYAALAGGAYGHTLGLVDSDGGIDTINAAPLRSDTLINLNIGAGNIAGVAFGAGSVSGIENVIGGDGDDIFTGDAGANVLRGMRGNDTLVGGSGNDELFGYTGNDRLVGGENDDHLDGAEGDDTLLGSNGDDLSFGGAGNDRLVGSEGADTLYGEDGRDDLILGIGDDVGYGGAGNDFISGGTGNDLIFGADGDDILIGGLGIDSLYGGVGNDLLRGGADADVLVGSDGADTLFGEVGDDRIIGSAGDDRLSGGGGADTFVFSGNWDDDVIPDFQVGVDTIRVVGQTAVDVTLSALGGGLHTLATLTSGDTINFRDVTVAQLSGFADWDFV